MPMDENIKLVQTVKDETQDPLSAFSVFQGVSEETKRYFLSEFQRKDEEAETRWEEAYESADLLDAEAAAAEKDEYSPTASLSLSSELDFGEVTDPHDV